MPATMPVMIGLDVPIVTATAAKMKTITVTSDVKSRLKSVLKMSGPGRNVTVAR